MNNEKLMRKKLALHYLLSKIFDNETEDLVNFLTKDKEDNFIEEPLIEKPAEVNTMPKGINKFKALREKVLAKEKQDNQSNTVEDNNGNSSGT